MANELKKEASQKCEYYVKYGIKIRFLLINMIEYIDEYYQANGIENWAKNKKTFLKGFEKKFQKTDKDLLDSVCPLIVNTIAKKTFTPGFFVMNARLVTKKIEKEILLMCLHLFATRIFYNLSLNEADNPDYKPSSSIVPPFFKKVFFNSSKSIFTNLVSQEKNNSKNNFFQAVTSRENENIENLISDSLLKNDFLTNTVGDELAKKVAESEDFEEYLEKVKDDDSNIDEFLKKHKEYANVDENDPTLRLYFSNFTFKNSHDFERYIYLWCDYLDQEIHDNEIYNELKNIIVHDIFSYGLEILNDFRFSEDELGDVEWHSCFQNIRFANRKKENYHSKWSSRYYINESREFSTTTIKKYATFFVTKLKEFLKNFE